jgi:hypothetical protein
MAIAIQKPADELSTPARDRSSRSAERGGPVGDRPADDPAREGVHYRRAIHLPFSGRVFGDIGQPQTIRLVDAGG